MPSAGAAAAAAAAAATAVAGTAPAACGAAAPSSVLQIATHQCLVMCSTLQRRCKLMEPFCETGKSQIASSSVHLASWSVKW